jgi:hypothetical protein
MPYTINKFNGTVFTTLQDGQLNVESNIGLVGRNYVGYGEIQNENFLYLLENFANDGAPNRPVIGQTWFDTKSKIMNVYNGSQWSPIGSATVADAAPLSPVPGQVWFDTKNAQLYTYHNSAWTFIGPESVVNFGTTRAKAVGIKDSTGTTRPILILTVNETPIAICSAVAFTIAQTNPVNGFLDVVAGLTISSLLSVKGAITGNADSASKLKNTVTINGVGFNGESPITINANTTNKLTAGMYILGNEFDGSSPQTWTINASSTSSPGTVVVRDGAGSFSAAVVKANLEGNVIGTVTAPDASLSKFGIIEAKEYRGAAFSGTAESAIKLTTARRINGVLFDGTVDINPPANAASLTGTTINSSVTASNLKTLGTLDALYVANTGINVGSVGGPQLKLSVIGNIPTINAPSGNFNLDLGASGASLTFINATAAGSLNWDTKATIYSKQAINIGSSANKINKIYATEFNGTATAAQYADLAENYVADAQYPAGTVVEFGGEFEVTIGTNESPRVAGVISTQPAYLMNSMADGEFVVPVALQGKVPCKVSGTIRKGDLLVSGGYGYAISGTHPKIGTVIGKAIEDFDGEYGVINIVVGRV